MKKIILLMLLITSCTNPDGAKMFLEENGFSDIQITGYDFFADGDDEMTSTGFIATNYQGRVLVGAVTEKFPWVIFKPKFSLRVWRTE